MQLTRRAPLYTLRRPVRDPDRQVLTGLAAGMARGPGVDPALVRAAFAVLSFAGGLGLFLYVALWALSTPDGEHDVFERPPLSGPRQVAAVACITLGLLIPAREAGLWLGDGAVWPVALASLGVSVIWVRGDGSLRGLGSARGGDSSPFSGAGVLRIGIGSLLILGGMAAVLAANMTFTLRRVFDLTLPVLVSVTGLSLIFGPWLLTLARQVTDERRGRIRSQERSDMAAHLHDSVLQTLALIQRAGSVREMSALARVQERELRAWLYGKGKLLDVDTVEAAVDALAGKVERAHHVSVEAVVVGDAPLDERLAALVHACGEATINAARHSGESSISVYVEIGGGEATAYVRDHGRGFDPATVAPDRRGIADSVVGRMKRYGGTASITSAPDRGTEVRLTMPL